MKKLIHNLLRVTLLLGLAFFVRQGYAQEFASLHSPDAMYQKQTPAATLSLKEALQLLEKKHAVFFFFENELVDHKMLAKPFVPKKGLETELSQLLSPFDLSFKKVDNSTYAIFHVRAKVVPVTPAPAVEAAKRPGQPLGLGNAGLLPVPMAALQPIVIDLAITGKITDEENNALVGAKVLLKGTATGAVSDNNGEYRLSVPELQQNGTLIFSYYGYKTLEVAIDGRSRIDVAIKSDVQSMDEVVVVGYAVQKKSDITGAIGSVNGKDIRTMPARSVNEALQGRVAGVQVTRGSGEPGSAADIVIRGPGSINGMSPLYIVDGVRVSGTGNNFNIQDIESIEVLKDASAASIYGVGAAGGVILITTKRGDTDRMSVNFNTWIGTRQAINLYSLLDRDEFIRGKAAFGSNTSGWGNASTLPNTDWVNELFNNGSEQNYSLSLSGGSKKATYFVSANYLNEVGVRIDNSFERYNFRANSDYQINKRLKVGQTLFAWRSAQNPTQSGLIPFRSVPTMPVYDATNPVGGWGRQPIGGYYEGGNPFADELISTRNNVQSATEGNLFAELQIVKGLSLRATGGASLINSSQSSFREPFNYGSLANPNAEFNIRLYNQQNYTFNSVLTYDRTFGSHSIKALVGYEAYREDADLLQGNAIGFTVPFSNSFSLSSSPGSRLIQDGVAGLPLRRLVSQFARINYSFANKYLVSATVRRDGSDRFGPANRFGVFPGFSLGWRINEEGFMDNVSAISNLKLRGGYGELGFDGIAQFLYLPTYGSVNITGTPEGDRVQGFGITQLANEKVKWEVVRQTDIGLDLGLWNDKLNFTIDWYNRLSSDVLYSVPVPLSGGLGGSVFVNVGEVLNRGLELAADYRGTAGDFTYRIGANVAFNRNEVLNLDGTNNVPINRGYGGDIWSASISRTEVGQPFGQFFGFISEGIIQTDEQIQNLNTIARQKAADRGVTNTSDIYYQNINTGAGDLLYTDVDGDGQITNEDRTAIGNPQPKVVYGVNVNLAWKGIDLALLFQGVGGVQIYNGSKAFSQNFFGDYNTTSDVFDNSFFAGNGLTDQPRIGFTNTNNEYIRDPNGNYSRPSSYFVENGSYLRLANLQLGYNLPAEWMSAARIRSARIYFMGQNLFRITGYSGMDPEISGSPVDRGIDNIFQYPRTRMTSLGLDINF